MTLFIIILIVFLNLEEIFMDTFYTCALYIVNPDWNTENNPPSVDQLISFRLFEKKIVWCLGNFMTACAMLYLFHCQGKSVLSVKDRVRGKKEIHDGSERPNYFT